MVLDQNQRYLLFDDDCGICTTFARFLGKLLHEKVKVIPMHIPTVEQEGQDKVGNDYWKSFHIINFGEWTTEGKAIIALARLFPLGHFLGMVAQSPPIYSFLMFLLRRMQVQRKLECEVELSF